MSKSTKILVRKQRSLHTYSELWHASKCVLQAGIDHEIGSTWQFLSSIVLTAFTFEAYLNHIGPRTLHSWDSLERSPVWSKFLVLSEVLGVQFPSGGRARPVQTIQALFKFRNSIAHGQSKELNTDEIVTHRFDIDPFATSPRAEWEKQIRDPKFVQRAREDVEAVLRTLHAARLDDRERLFSFGIGHHSATALLTSIPAVVPE